jgi:signal peptidase II
MNTEMQKSTGLESMWWLLVSMASFGIDQVIKILLVTGWWGDARVFDWFRIEVYFNHGLAFGLGEGYGLMISLIALVVFLYFIFTNISWWQENIWPQIGVGMVLGGAFSNLIDRFRFEGGVVDYLNITFYTVLNLADIFIFVGLLILIYKFWNYDNIRK